VKHGLLEAAIQQHEEWKSTRNGSVRQRQKNVGCSKCMELTGVNANENCRLASGSMI
jgi:hypothetical protein